MDTQQFLPRAPGYARFRVLIIGRANAGKTTILQRVCDTTESPVISKRDQVGFNEEVQLEPSVECGEHDIEDELTFTNHAGYVFHDSRGFESGTEQEVKIVQEFVRRRSQERRLNDRLHAIWYCVPMDNARPSLDLKYFEEICPDKNVPVIAVFTKYDQFKREICFKLEDQRYDPDTSLLNAEVERIFQGQYLANLKGSPPIVRLEKMHKRNQQCTELIEKTANELSDGVVSLMLLAVQENNLELGIKEAVRRAYFAMKQGSGNIEGIIKSCIMAFPSFWAYVSAHFLSGL